MWAETGETKQIIDKLSSPEENSVIGIVEGMATNPKRTNTIIDDTFKDASSLVANEDAKQVEKQNYLTNILHTVTKFTQRVPKIPYGMKDGVAVPGGLVCDQFVKKVLKANNTNIDDVYGTIEMFRRIKPNKKVIFKEKKIVEIPPVWSILFCIEKKICGHVGFFMGMKDGKPQIADANNSWVSQRELRPAERSKIYYEENYREKFIAQKTPKKKMI